EVVKNTVLFEHVTYRVAFKIVDQYPTDSWKARVLHEGYDYLHDDGETIQVKTFMDKHSNPKKVNLDAEGKLLDKDAAPVYLEFNRFPKRDFNVLGLGPF